jgi:hypothetical protein
MGHQLNSVARLAGNTYAHVQHGIDKAIEWGFRTIERQAKSTPKKASKKPTGVAGNAAAFARGFFGMIGEAGSAYFRTYEELKKGGK